MALSANIDVDCLEDQLLKELDDSRQGLVRKYVKASKEYHQERRETEPESAIVRKFSGIEDKYLLAEKGMEPQLAYEMIHSDMALDGNTTLNLASFVNVHVDPFAQNLIDENLTKNLADNDEYPLLLELQDRCISVLANLWHAPKKGTAAAGTACTGSSEAALLGGLAMKKNWQARRKKEGKSTENPNVLLASCCQVCLEKFARYFDVEARIVPVEPQNYLINYREIRKNLDENTIGVFVILGSTYTGGFENVQKVATILDEFEKETGNYVPIHVDGASGGDGSSSRVSGTEIGLSSFSRDVNKHIRPQVWAHECGIGMGGVPHKGLDPCRVEVPTPVLGRRRGVVQFEFLASRVPCGAPILQLFAVGPARVLRYL